MNLLPLSKKKSKSPGDSTDMIAARHDFLRQNHFLPLLKALQATISDHTELISNNLDYHLLDCGCGEGYYTSFFQKHLTQSQGKNLQWHGIDISKPAIKRAAKSNSNIHFAIASAFTLPLPKQSIDCALQIFSPAADRSISDTLKHNGLLIRVTPGPNHLLELRQHLFNQIRPYTERNPNPTLFAKTNSQNIDFTLENLESKAIEALFKMTPFYWRASHAAREQILQVSSLTLSADFIINCYKKIEN